MLQDADRLTPLSAEGMPALPGFHAASLPGITLLDKVVAVVLAGAAALPSILLPASTCEGASSYVDVGHFAAMMGLFFVQFFVLVVEDYGLRAQALAVGGGIVVMLGGTALRVAAHAYGVRNWTPVIACATLPSLLVPIFLICTETEPAVLRRLRGGVRRATAIARLGKHHLLRQLSGSGDSSSSGGGGEEHKPLANPMAPHQQQPVRYGATAPPPPAQRQPGKLSLPYVQRASLLRRIRMRARSAAAAGSLKGAMQRRRLIKFGWTVAVLFVVMCTYHFCITFSAWFVATADTPDKKTTGIVIFYVATALLMAVANAAGMKADRTRAFNGQNSEEFLDGRGDWLISNRVRLIFDLYIAVFTVHLFPLLSTWVDFAAIKVAALAGKLVMFPPRMSATVRRVIARVPVLRAMLGDTLAQDREKASFELFSTGIAEAVAFFSYIVYVSLMRFALPTAAFPQFSARAMSGAKYRALMVFLLASAVVDTATRLLVRRVLLHLTSITTDQVRCRLLAPPPPSPLPLPVEHSLQSALLATHPPAHGHLLISTGAGGAEALPGGSAAADCLCRQRRARAHRLVLRLLHQAHGRRVRRVTVARTGRMCNTLSLSTRKLMHNTRKLIAARRQPLHLRKKAVTPRGGEEARANHSQRVFTLS